MNGETQRGDPPEAEVQTLPDIPAVQESPPQPGTKEAVLRHFGVFQDDDDLEVQLAGIRAAGG